MSKTALRLLTLSILLIVLLSGESSPIAYAQAQLGPLTVEDLLSTKTFAPFIPIDLSPDGDWIAYTLQDNQRKEQSTGQRYRLFTRTGVYFAGVGGDVWVTNVKTGESRNLTGGKGNNWSPTWSPDGRYLAFYSDRGGMAGLWLWEKGTDKLRAVSKAIVRSLANHIQWTLDSRQVVIKLLPEDMTVEQAADLLVGPQDQQRNEKKFSGSTVIVYRSSATVKSTSIRAANSQTGPWSFANRLSDLASVDIATGKVRRLARNSFISNYWLSPDSLQIAYTSPKKFEAMGSQQILFDLTVVSRSTGQTRVVAPSIQLDSNGASVSWSPDSKMLSYRAAGMSAKGDVFVISAAGGQPRNLTAAPHPNFAGYGLPPPLWDNAGQNVVFVGDKALWRASLAEGKLTKVAKIPQRQLELIALKTGNRFWSRDEGQSIIVRFRDDETKQVGFYKVQLATGQAVPLLEESKFYSISLFEDFFGQTVANDAQHFVYLAEDPQHGQELWLADAAFRNRKRLTRINPRLDAYQMGSSRLVDWQGLDGQRLRGALLLPAGYQEGKRYPLIVNVYPRYSSDDLNRFGLAATPVDNFQLLATRGYAVLLPDSPRRVGTPMTDMMKTVMPGIDKLIEMGIADPDRLGIMGHSNGGYCTLSLIVQTPRFKAAIVNAGFGDLIGLYGQLRGDGTAFGIGIVEPSLIGGSLWDYRSRYVENSPVFYLDKVQTPVLIIHGGADDAISPFLADQIFVGLRRLGKEVEYAKYEGEGHSQGTWGFANQVDYMNRLLAWFEKNLKGSTGVSQQ